MVWALCQLPHEATNAVECRLLGHPLQAASLDHAPEHALDAPPQGNGVPIVCLCMAATADELQGADVV